MNLSDDPKLLFLKSSFKDIDELKAEEFYKSRASLFGNVYKGIKEDNEIKKYRWFYLLSAINESIQFGAASNEEDDKIFNEFLNHPYYSFYKQKSITNALFQNRKFFQEMLAKEDKEIAKIFYGIYHLHNEVRHLAIRDFSENLENAINCQKQNEVIKNIKEKLPILYEEYAEMFKACELKSKKKEKKRRIFDPKNVSKEVYIGAVIIIIYIIKTLLVYFAKEH